MSRGPVVWTPGEAAATESGLARYLRWLADEPGRDFASYAELWAWSVDDLEGFWGSIWRYFDIQATPYDAVLTDRAMPGTRWFEGARLNYAEHALRGGEAGAIAIIEVDEAGGRRELRWDELRLAVGGVARALRERGIGPGDVVAGYLPNCAEAVIAYLACASVGAIWSSCAPDLAPAGVLDRFAQLRPAALIGCDGYRYGGRDHDRLDTVRALQEAIPTLERTVVLGYLGDEPALRPLKDATRWDEFAREGDDAGLSFAQVPFDHPLWVLYSSGTTGLPKAIVHGHGGILLELSKQVGLHVDLQRNDRLFWFTTTGWMMWNFLNAALLTEASIVLYDGSPGHPSLDTLWDLAAASGVTCFGTSASFIAACLKDGVEPRAGRDLSLLEALGSTGSPLSPEAFDWVYDQLGPDVWLFSTSGGTDLCTAFVGGVPTLPVYRGELQARALGAKVEAWNADGKPVVGEVGELVITEPMPSMPLYLWGDDDGSRYRASYFETFPGVWRHGDWIEITERGTAIITGRSDATINRGGIRMGTAEIYRAVLSVPEVVDALVVDLPREGTQGYMPLFVVLQPGRTLDDDLVAAIRDRIREECSPRHVPDEIRAVPAVPRTLSGKVLEVPVKRILSGEPTERAVSRDSLVDPDALRPFEELAATADWRKE